MRFSETETLRVAGGVGGADIREIGGYIGGGGGASFTGNDKADRAVVSFSGLKF